MTHDQWTSAAGPGDDPPDPAADALLDRYLAGESTLYERELVERALARAEGDAALAALVRVWKGGEGASPDLDDARARIAHRIGRYPEAAVFAGGAAEVTGAARTADTPTADTSIGVAARGVAPAEGALGSTGHVAGRVAGARWARLAAGAVVAFAVAGVAFVTRSASHDRTSPGRTYATATGQRAAVTLGDGTRVTLAPMTRLVVSDFGPRARTVALEGEAYFDVANAGPGRGAPFVVRAAGVSARVLGTGFVVRHYAGDAAVRVAVRSGKVAVAAPGARGAVVTLTAGRGVDVTDSTAVALPAEDANASAAWVDGRLFFHNAPAPDVFATLTRWYGYEFRMADSSIARQNLTAVLSTESSQQALATIKLLLNVDLTFEGKLVTLTPRRPGAVAPGKRRDVIGDMTSHNSEVGR